MALVALVRGINVGGHKTFRPTALVEPLKRFDVVNIGAAGTFVVRRPIAEARLRAEITRRLPFEAEIVICDGARFLRVVEGDPFAGERFAPDVVRFVSVLARPPRAAPATPMRFPSTGRWLLRVLARDDRFVFGVYRRHMKVIGYLGALDRLFGVPATTRGWSTITAIARALAPA